MNKEAGGAVLAFAGFVFLVMAVKGTWSNVWHDLFKGSTAKPTTNTTTQSGPVQVPFPAGPGIKNSPFFVYPNLPSSQPSGLNPAGTPGGPTLTLV